MASNKEFAASNSHGQIPTYGKKLIWSLKLGNTCLEGTLREMANHMMFLFVVGGIVPPIRPS